MRMVVLSEAVPGALAGLALIPLLVAVAFPVNVTVTPALTVTCPARCPSVAAPAEVSPRLISRQARADSTGQGRAIVDVNQISGSRCPTLKCSQAGNIDVGIYVKVGGNVS